MLVFDNFQDLPLVSPLQELWQSLILVLAEEVNLIFLSRNAPPDSFSPYRVARKLIQLWVGVVDTIFNLLDGFHDLEPWIDEVDSLIGRYGQPTPSLVVQPG